MSILIIAAIALAVVLGYKTKINTGFFCIAFAYIIGCFMLGMKTKDLIAEWPTSTMFVILAVSLFYNFAAVNGTLEKMSSSLLYACRRFPGMLPYALFLVAVVLSVMGAGYFTWFWPSWLLSPWPSVRSPKWTSSPAPWPSTAARWRAATSPPRPWALSSAA